MSPSRDERLAVLGVTRWVRRDRQRRSPGDPRASAGGTLSEDALAPYRAVQLPTRPVAVVIVRAAQAATPGAGDPAGMLLGKILAALGAPLARFLVLHAPERSALDPTPVERLGGDAGRPVLAFVGEEPTPAAWIRLPTLARMLADDSAKRPAWAALKPLAGRLS